MSAPPANSSLLERLKRARIVQVLLVYLGASWVILQIADVLAEALSLPGWVLPVCVLLLLVGLLIILATAWVQSLASTTAKERAGEIPTDWEIAPAEALKSLRSGKLPHLTWGRAILGGVVALSLLFGGTGMYVGLTGGPRLIGPTEAGADVAAAGIAVVPFDITGGEELNLWREGMVDLLSTNLDGMGGFRTIDSRTVMAQWRERVPGEETPDLRTALEAAARTGARYAVVGAMVGNPAGVRVSADIYDLSTGEKVGQVSEEGGADAVLSLTSALSVNLTRALLQETGQGTVQDVRIGALTTTSLPALRAYLEGEASFRQANFAAAVTAYERAVELDSLFALAWHRLANAYGWLDDIGNPTAALAGERSATLLDRLPARDRILVQASEASRTGDPTFLDDIQEGVRLYPDDPDLWFELGEYIYHVGTQAGTASLEQAMEAFERAVELDRGFGPYQVHPLELTIAMGDRAAAEAMLERYRTSTEDVTNISEFEIALPLLLGDEAELQAALAQSQQVPVGTLDRIRLSYMNRQDRYDRLREMMWVNRSRAGSDHQWIYYNLGAEGAVQRAARLSDSLTISQGNLGLGAGWMLGSWEAARDTRLTELADPRHCEQPALNGQCLMFAGWGLARSGDLGRARRALGAIRRYASEREGDAAAGWAQLGDVVEGTIAAEEGDVAKARRLLGPVAPISGNQGSLARRALAEVEFAEGNVTEAVRLNSGNMYNYVRSATMLAQARIYESRGDAEKAREHYRRFLDITRAGDQDMPELVAAREALARLGG